LFVLKEKKSLFYYLIVFALISPLVLIPTVVQSRYRFQIYPFLAIFGGYALVSICHKNAHSKRIVAMTGIGFLIISLVDAGHSWSTILDHLHLFIK